MFYVTQFVLQLLGILCPAVYVITHDTMAGLFHLNDLVFFFGFDLYLSLLSVKL